ncbi:hypothetical protein Q0M94_01105 [Deinococcus radiomollis]|uniref:hypothetical protein n=1 Tax=Deinococcus radiomollis TaxID=468916 RepID=UPI0038929F5A
MRPQIAVLAAFTLLPCAQAADLTGVLSDYLLRKVPPTESKVIDMSQYPGMSDILKGMARMTKTDLARMKASLIAQTMSWKNPANLNADSLAFVYLYKLGPDYWTLVLSNPRQPLSDYLGTAQLRLVGQTPSATPLNIYRVEGGRFSGFLAEDGVVRGTRTVVLLTPQIVAESPAMARYLK